MSALRDAMVRARTFLRDCWRGWSDRDWASAIDKYRDAHRRGQQPLYTKREAKALREHSLWRP